jgi:zinc transporter ZupT
VALLIAIGIGLHNLGEGLAIGTSYATGEIALGTSLLVGFLLHNTTEGLGIISPLTNEQPGWGRLALLGIIAGVPTVLGTWIGGFSYSPVLTTLFFALGAGAIIQVIYELIKLFTRRGRTPLLAPWTVAGLLSGIMIMYLTGLVAVAG